MPRMGPSRRVAARDGRRTLGDPTSVEAPWSRCLYGGDSPSSSSLGAADPRDRHGAPSRLEWSSVGSGPVVAPRSSVGVARRRRGLTSCAAPGCPVLVPGGRCPEHAAAQRKAQDARRPSARERGYDVEWERNAKAFLAENPWCVDCGAPATDADHDPIDRVELIRLGVPDPDAWWRLKPRCHPCHSARTSRGRRLT